MIKTSLNHLYRRNIASTWQPHQNQYAFCDSQSSSSMSRFMRVDSRLSRSRRRCDCDKAWHPSRRRNSSSSSICSWRSRTEDSRSLYRLLFDPRARCRERDKSELLLSSIDEHTALCTRATQLSCIEMIDCLEIDDCSIELCHRNDAWRSLARNDYSNDSLKRVFADCCCIFASMSSNIAVFRAMKWSRMLIRIDSSSRRSPFSTASWRCCCSISDQEVTIDSSSSSLSRILSRIDRRRFAALSWSSERRNSSLWDHRKIVNRKSTDSVMTRPLPSSLSSVMTKWFDRTKRQIWCFRSLSRVRTWSAVRIAKNWTSLISINASIDLQSIERKYDVIELNLTYFHCVILINRNRRRLSRRSVIQVRFWYLSLRKHDLFSCSSIMSLTDRRSLQQWRAHSKSS